MVRLCCVCLGWTLLTIAGCSQDSPAGYHEVTEVPSESAAATTPVALDDATQPIEVSVAADAPAARVAETPPDTVSSTPVGPATGVALAPATSPPGNLLPASLETIAPAIPKPGGIQLLIPEKEFQKEGDEQALRVSFDDLDLLKVLNMEPVPLDATKHFPSWLSSLDGQKIRLRGWMFPPLEQEGLTGFLFVRDNQICCFGRNPKVYDKVIVQLREGETTKYIQGRPFDVVGTFSIMPEESDGELMILYFIDDAVVIDR